MSGSILLPSYTVSPLSKDDGVYRKYAFKAEHANMRTYYFAAETKDSMIQWMNSLSLASILQNENKLRQFPHFPRQFPSMQHLSQATRRAGQEAGWQPGPPEPGPARQPLYANAPPKPRRLNTSRDSPSPEPSPDRGHQQFSPHKQQFASQQHHFSPQQHQFSPQQQQQQQQQFSPTHQQQFSPQQFSPQQQFPHNNSQFPQNFPFFPAGGQAGSPESEAGLGPLRHRLPQERRTPEAYGRSRFEAAGRGWAGQHKEYEEVLQQQQQWEEAELARYTARPAPPRVPRPHSADFLEYERTNPAPPAARPAPGPRTQPQRPKSCIGEKVRQDDFWSEEVYAQKMRESSRSASRASQPGRAGIPRATTLPGPLPAQAAGQAGFHPLQLSPARGGVETSAGLPGQLPPPVSYQDTSPNYQQHNYQADQEVAASFQPARAPPQYHYRHHQSDAAYKQQMMMQAPPANLNHHESPQNNEQMILQSSNQQMRKTPVHLSPAQQTPRARKKSGAAGGQAGHPATMGYSDSNAMPRITVPPSLPQPQPRGGDRQLATPTPYQNLPTNSKAVSDPRPVSSASLARQESATPSRLTDRLCDSDRSSESQEFRRSASARLPRNKQRPVELNNTLQDESDETRVGRHSEQIGVSQTRPFILFYQNSLLDVFTLISADEWREHGCEADSPSTHEEGQPC